MRREVSCLIILLVCCAATAQQPAQGNVKERGTGPVDEPKSVSGCLSGDATEGYFLGSDTGDLYQVIGDNAVLKEYAGKTVRITGAVANRKPSWSASRVLATLPPTLRPNKISKVFDTCE
jgi:hypothetical protein